MKPIDDILNNEKEVLEFLKSHYPMYHLSNVFFRDMQYGIRTLLERRGEKVGYTESESIARKFVEKLEKEKILRPIDRQSWVLNYPAFKKPAVVQATPAKPAPGAAPVKSPAAGKPAASPAAARPPLPPLGSAKPAGASSAAGATSKLPPLTSAKPAGAAKPGLPPITSAKPTDGQPAPASQPASEDRQSIAAAKPETSGEQKIEQPEAQGSVAAQEQPAPPVQKPATAPSGEKRMLPPLKGNYKPVGKA